MPELDLDRLEPGMPVSEQTFLQVALEDPSGHWELHCGALRQKPDMTAPHNRIMSRLSGWLFQQLDLSQFEVRTNSGHVRRSPENYYIPDVSVIPTEFVERQMTSLELETYGDPLPLVVEIWSPSTGQYDVTIKLHEYQRRGDLEIWLIHPYDRVLRAWRRQPDGSYTESAHTSGAVQPVALPNVTIDLDALFA
jgi:Uma2 family endonuclease